MKYKEVGFDEKEIKFRWLVFCNIPNILAGFTNEYEAIEYKNRKLSTFPNYKWTLVEIEEL